MKFGMRTGLDGRGIKNYIDVEVDSRRMANIKLIKTEINPFTNEERQTIYEGSIQLEEV